MKKIVFILIILLCGCNSMEVNRIIDVNKKVVAITFDDGPSVYTNKLLDVLDFYDVNATFFVVGNKVKRYEDVLKRMVKRNDEIGNHSYSHKWLTRLKLGEMEKQINMTQDVIFDVTGYRPKLLRPTYGAVNRVLRKNTDLSIVLWNVDSMDWKTKNSTKIAYNVLNKVQNGDIILFHDTYERTLNALKIIIPKLLIDGYQFVTVSELKAYNGLNK